MTLIFLSVFFRVEKIKIMIKTIPLHFKTHMHFTCYILVKLYTKSSVKILKPSIKSSKILIIMKYSC